jgi:sugar/nucleoside kinase (ribokinase family)
MDSEEIGRHNLLHRTTRRNGSYLIETDTEKKSHLTFWRKDSAATTLLQSYSAERLFSRISNSRYFLFSMIAIGMLRKRERLLETLSSLPPDTQTIFDLNYRASLWKNRKEYIDTLSLIPRADYIMQSSSDGEVDEELLVKLGAKAIIKRNADAPTLVKDGNDEYEVPIHKSMKFVDSVGAGDAFNSGFIYGLRNEFSLSDAVLLGNICGSVATEKAGGINIDFSGHKALRTFNLKRP